MLWIGRDDISNDVITLGVCFHVFFNFFFLHLHSFQLHTERQKSDSSVDREPPGNSNSRDMVASSSPFPAPLTESPRELARRLLNSEIVYHHTLGPVLASLY